jgi:hypothetical protein
VSQALYRRCGCRDANGKQLARACPQLTQDAKHGSWAYYYSNGTDPRTGKRRQFTKGGFPTRKAADKALTELKHQLGQGTYVPPSDKILATFAQEVMERRLVTGRGLKPTTAATYQRYVAQDIAPSRLGGMKLTEIRRSDVNLWVADLTKSGRGAVTVRRALATLQMIMSQAVRDEIISASPAVKIDKPAVADTVRSIGSPNILRSSSSGADITGLGRCSSWRSTPAYAGVRSPVCTGPTSILLPGRSPSGTTA